MSKSRILVAVSSPWASQRLIEPVVDLARRLGAETLVAHVAHSQAEDETEADANQRGEQTLATLTAALKEAGITSEGLMLFSDNIARAILKTAASRQCTMIVLGWGGKTLWKRWLGKNVPRSVVRHAQVPVLLIPSVWAGSL